MAWDSLTDEMIALWLKAPKHVTNPKGREATKAKHLERNYSVSADSGEKFSLYVRQSTIIAGAFSCGLAIEMPGQERLTLCRYNGNDHPHINPIEQQRMDFCCHIHRATARYIAAGRKPESYAEKTDRYHTVNGALACLLSDCNIRGLDSPHDEPDLFA